MSLWRAYPDCPDDARERIEKVVRSLPVESLDPLLNNEVVQSADACLRRLQGFALSEGFAVVKVSGSLTSKRPRIQYKCVHHGKETRNFRQLEDHIDHDAEGAVTSRRRRENTYTLKKECPWAVSLVKHVPGKADDMSFLSLTVTFIRYSHSMAVNPLQYRQHEKTLEDYVKAARIAATHRESFLPYSVSQRILAKEGLNLSRTDYYNLHRERAVE